MANENTSTTSASKPAELPMAEYAAAVLKGENPIQKAAAIEGKVEDQDTDQSKDTDTIVETETDEGKTTTESAPEVNPEEQIEESHPAKKGISKRFSELTAKQKELQAQADAAKAATEAANKRAEEALAESARLRKEAETAQAALPLVVEEKDDPVPDRRDYDDPDEYTVAISAHAIRQEIRRSSQAAQQLANERAEAARKSADEARQAQVNTAIAELHNNFQKRVAEVKPEYPDYKEKVEENETLVLKNEVFFTIEKSVDAPHILYHLASNPELAEELNKLNQFDAAMRIGEMQAELRYARKPKPSKAAAPIKPVGNRSSPQQKSPNEESMTEYAARVEKEMAANAHKRTRII